MHLAPKKGLKMVAAVIVVISSEELRILKSRAIPSKAKKKRICKSQGKETY